MLIIIYHYTNKHVLLVNDRNAADMFDALRGIEAQLTDIRSYLSDDKPL
jgi:hypothetical protein